MCGRSTGSPRCRRWCATWTTRSGWRSRCAAGWSGGGGSSELAHRGAEQDLLPGIASLFNGALFRASTLEAVGVPDLRLFVRGDEVELHRRLVRSGLPFGTCLDAVYLHPQGSDEFKPILGGRMHTQYPDDASQAVLHLPQPRLSAVAARPAETAAVQEWLRFGWYFLVSRRDPAGLRGVDPAAAAWAVARSSKACTVTFTDAAAQSRTMTRAWGDLVAGFGKRELWLHLGWQDIKQRYRRSVLGPFWITIATGTTAVAMGLVVLEAVQAASCPSTCPTSRSA